MTTATCPSHEELHAFSIGLLSDEVSDAIAAHLASCTDCRAGLSTLDGAEDTFLTRLRRPTVADPYLEESQCQVAVARAFALSATPPEGRSSRTFQTKTLGEYQLIGELGRGGMGKVYKALHTKLDRVVALKVLSRGRVEDPQAISRFAREMRAVGKISHPNVVQAHDAREIDGMPVLVMEFVDGLDLAEVVRRCTSRTHHAPREGILHAERDEYGVPIADACELVRRTALGLQCAHERGLVHRDIKPSNIMLAAPLALYSGRGRAPCTHGRGEGGAEVKLMDLGLARFYAEDGSNVSLVADGEEMTGTGQAMGTADYMAPEQASDSRTVDIRADIYSLGCTLYKLLSGRAPFSGAAYRSTLDKLHAHVHQPVPPIRDIVPEVPEELAAILDRMLAKDPAARFDTPADVAAALEPFCKNANLVALMERAMASGGDSPSLGESIEDSRRPLSELAVASPPRRRILRQILIGLGFLGALGAAFAAGVIITINRDGKKTTVELEDGSKARVTADGLEVTLPGHANPAEQASAIQGTWEVVSSTLKLLQKLPAAKQIANDQVVETTKIVITADTLKIVGDHVRDVAFEYKVNPAASPKIIDLKGAGMIYLGIYRLEGNQLTICAEENKRPSELWAEFGSSKELLVLRRVGDAVISEDEKAIQGRWEITSQSVEEGLVPPQSLVDYWVPTNPDAPGVNPDVPGVRDLIAACFAPGSRAAISQRSITLRGSSKVPADLRKRLHDYEFYIDFANVEYALDPAQQPKRIDLAPNWQNLPSIGPFSGIHGTYEMTGDELQLRLAVSESPNFKIGGRNPHEKPYTVVIVLKRANETSEKTPGQGTTQERPANSAPAAAPPAATLPEVAVVPQAGYSYVREVKVPPAAAPPEVAVVQPIVRQVADREEFTGHIEAAQSAEVRSRVSGNLAKALIKPGAMVKQGDLLFELDPAPFQAEQDKREADVRLAEARLKRTTAELNEAKAPAANDRERLKAQQAEAEAALAAAQQGLKVASLNLASTRLTAPLSGRIGRPLVTIGSLVTDAMPLAVIDSVDPVGVAFDIDERTFLKLRRNPPRSNGESGHAILVGLSDEKDFSHKATFQSADTRIIPATGCARYRASLPNPDGLLAPGMFVRVRIATSDPHAALLVPERSLGSDQGQNFVFIVTDQNVVQRRDVQTGQQVGDGMRAVEKGLNADDWVATSQLQLLRPGATVKPLKPPTPSPSSSNVKPPTMGPAELSLYAGKTFDQWRDLARSDLDDETRAKAFQALGVFARSGTSDEAVSAILAAMKVDQPANVLNAAYLVLRMTGSQGEAAIVSGVRHEDTRHRLAAVKALENDYSRNTYAVPALIEVLGDSDPKIRRTAAHALEHIALATEPEFKNDGHAIHIRPEGEIGPTTKAVVPALCRLLKDSDSNVRCEAVESLARMGKSANASIPDLITFVETAFSKVKTELANHARRGAEVELECGVEALERMGPAASAAVPLLTAIKELNLLNVIRAAEKALDSIQPQRNPGRRQGRGSNPAGATKVPDHDRGYTT